MADELDERGVISSILCGSMRPSGLVASLRSIRQYSDCRSSLIFASGAIGITHPKSSLTLIVSLSSLRRRSIVIGVATGYGRSELVLVRGLLALWL